MFRNRCGALYRAGMGKVLSIQSEVAGARVGNSVARFALERLGVDTIALPTTLFGRRPDRGAPGGGAVPAAQLASMVEALDADGALAQVSHIVSGYLADAAQAEVVRDAVARVRRVRPDVVYVCDPVMGDQGRLFVPETVRDAIVRRLAPIADILTPNAFEFEVLTGRPLPNLEAIATARPAPAALLVTSVPVASGVGVLLHDADGVRLLEGPLLPHAPKGAGDLFTALFVGRLALGQARLQAAVAAMGAVHDIITLAAASGADDLPVIRGQSLLADPMTRPAVVVYGGADN